MPELLHAATSLISMVTPTDRPGVLAERPTIQAQTRAHSPKRVADEDFFGGDAGFEPTSWAVRRAPRPPFAVIEAPRKIFLVRLRAG
jgi:hypothetical protein